MPTGEIPGISPLLPGDPPLRAPLASIRGPEVEIIARTWNANR